EPLRAEGGEVALEEIPENTSALVNFGGQEPFVLIVRGDGEDITAYSGYCTHNGCALRQEDAELDCPCHGSRFDAETGDVLAGPRHPPAARGPGRRRGRRRPQGRVSRR